MRTCLTQRVRLQQFCCCPPVSAHLSVPTPACPAADACCCRPVDCTWSFGNPRPYGFAGEGLQPHRAFARAWGLAPLAPPTACLSDPSPEPYLSPRQRQRRAHQRCIATAPPRLPPSAPPPSCPAPCHCRLYVERVLRRHRLSEREPVLGQRRAPDPGRLRSGRLGHGRELGRRVLYLFRRVRAISRQV